VANIKSQIKRNRQNDKKRLRNRVFRGEARIAVKTARTSIEQGVPESKAALAQAISALDKAAEQGVIHRNNAARRKGNLVKAFNRMAPIKEAPETVQPAVVEPAPVEKKPSRAAASKAKAAVSKKAGPVEKKPAAKKSTAAKKTTAAKSGTKKTSNTKAAAKKPASK
jgi:small subunit ribosomal protein S20